jgi:class 3 adenylate cyclase
MPRKACGDSPYPTPTFALASRCTMALGRYELKGFAEPAEVYSLVASSLSPRK